MAVHALQGDMTRSAAHRCTMGRESRRVWFCSQESTHEEFTPYADVYGAHPTDFDFDADGYMVLNTPISEFNVFPLDVSQVSSGTRLMCIDRRGVPYHARPQLA